MKNIKGYKLFTESKLWMNKIKDIENYIENSDMISDIWIQMAEYTSPNWNEGNVKITFTKIDKGDRNIEIPKLVVDVSLDDVVFDIPIGLHNRFDVIKGHECYNDLLECNEMTISALQLKKTDVKIAIHSYNTQDHIGSKRLTVSITYELTEAFLINIQDRLKFSDRDAHKYHNIIKSREDLKDNPIVKSLKKSTDKNRLVSDFRDAFVDLMRYGFKYKNIIEKISKFDLEECIEAGCEDSDIFFTMAMLGKYKCVDYLRNFTPDMFFYSSSSTSKNLGYELMRPFFIHCLKSSEVLWEQDEDELAVLYLVFEKKLLLTHLEGYDKKDQWVRILSDSFNDVSENLIAYNRKDSMSWIVDLLKSGELDVETKSSTSEFIEDLKREINRIESDFTRQSYIKSGKFKEVPDFEFFKGKIKELEDFIA